MFMFKSHSSVIYISININIYVYISVCVEIYLAIFLIQYFPTRPRGLLEGGLLPMQCFFDTNYLYNNFEMLSTYNKPNMLNGITIRPP